jgi:hypothetical protein
VDRERWIPRIRRISVLRGRIVNRILKILSTKNISRHPRRNSVFKFIVVVNNKDNNCDKHFEKLYVKIVIMILYC